MTSEEHKELINKVRTAATDAERGELLLSLQDDYDKIISAYNTANDEKKQAVEERDRYAKLNNELWLQNSAQTANGKLKNKETLNNDEETPPPPKKTYESLAAKYENEYNK